MNLPVNLLMRFKSHIESMLLSMSQLANLIEDEHKIVAESDLDQLERITCLKIDIGQKIEESTNSIYSVLSELRVLYPLSEDANTSITSISDIISEFGSVVGDRSKDLESKVYIKSLEECRQLVKDLYLLRKDSQPKIEMNMYLVQKSLNNHRETIMFWKNLIDNSASGYDSGGQSKELKSSAVLQVKA